MLKLDTKLNSCEQIKLLISRKYDMNIIN